MKKRIVIVSCLVVLILITLFIINSMRFKLVSSSPVDNVYPIGSNEAVFFFNKNLDPNISNGSLAIKTEPAHETTIKIEKSTLHIVFNNLPENDFVLTINNIKSDSGDIIPSIQRNYIVKKIPENELSKYEFNRRMSLVDVGVDKPTIVTRYFPIDVSPQYKITYGRSKKFPNDYGKGAIYISSASVQDKHDAIQMIYDIGYDPSDYEIIFKDMQVSS